jgi:hypothetical protein
MEDRLMLRTISGTTVDKADREPRTSVWRAVALIAGCGLVLMVAVAHLVARL